MFLILWGVGVFGAVVRENVVSVEVDHDGAIPPLGEHTQESGRSGGHVVTRVQTTATDDTMASMLEVAKADEEMQMGTREDKFCKAIDDLRYLNDGKGVETLGGVFHMVPHCRMRVVDQFDPSADVFHLDIEFRELDPTPRGPDGQLGYHPAGRMVENCFEEKIRKGWWRDDKDGDEGSDPGELHWGEEATSLWQGYAGWHATSRRIADPEDNLGLTRKELKKLIVKMGVKDWFNFNVRGKEVGYGVREQGESQYGTRDVMLVFERVDTLSDEYTAFPEFVQGDTLKPDGPGTEGCPDKFIVVFLQDKNGAIFRIRMSRFPPCHGNNFEREENEHLVAVWENVPNEEGEMVLTPIKFEEDTPIEIVKD